MTFHWALTEMKEGKKVRRKSWLISWSRLKQHMWLEKKGDGYILLKFLFSRELKGDDLVAEDWEEHVNSQNT